MKPLLNLYVAIVLFLAIFVGSCGPHKFGITGEINRAEDIHVFLHPKIIISAMKRENIVKSIDEVNDEKVIYDFFIPSGEQEIYIKTGYTRGIYLYRSKSVPVTLTTNKGDFVFICAEIKEIGSKPTTGGTVQTLLTPYILYLRTDEEKNKAIVKEVINNDYFNDRCNAVIYGKPEVKS